MISLRRWDGMHPFLRTVNLRVAKNISIICLGIDASEQLLATPQLLSLLSLVWEMTENHDSARTPFTSKMRSVRERYERVASEDRKSEQVFWMQTTGKLRCQDVIRAHIHWFPPESNYAAMSEPSVIDPAELAWLLVKS